MDAFVDDFAALNRAAAPIAFVGIQVLGMPLSDDDDAEDEEDLAYGHEVEHRNALQRLREELVVPMISAADAELTEPLLLPSLLTEAEVLLIFEAAQSMPGAAYDELVEPGDWDDHESGPHVDGLTAKHDTNYSDSHVALNLHRNGYFVSGYPELCAKLTTAMRSQPGRWCASDVNLNVRCVELHTYAAPSSGLMMKDHRDYGSVLTLSVLLSPSAKGGEFLTWRDGTPIAHGMARGDGILFHSEKVHNVSPVECGERRSLVIELWVRQATTSNRYY